MKIICKNCQKEIKEKTLNCPYCGCKDREIYDEDIAHAYESMKYNSKDKFMGKKGKKRFYVEGSDKREICKKDGKNVERTIRIDRINDYYYELVKDLNGNIIHETSPDERKLSKHKGHGSAKYKE